MSPGPVLTACLWFQTSGFDFRNNVNGDTYIFLLGDDIASYIASRGEFVTLAG